MAEFILIVWAICIVAFDMRSRRIPNLLTMGVAAIGMIILLVNGKTLLGSEPGPAWQGFGLAVLLTLPAYAVHLLGAGDVKLAAAIAILTSLHHFIAVYAFALLITLGLLLFFRYATYLPCRDLFHVSVTTLSAESTYRRKRNIPFGAALGTALLIIMSSELVRNIQ